MLCLRTFAVGLLLSGALIMETANKFIQWITLKSPVFAFQLAFHVVGGESGKIAGVGTIIPTAYILGCCGVGFLLAGIFYPSLEIFLFFDVPIMLDKAFSRLTRRLRQNKKATI